MSRTYWRSQRQIDGHPEFKAWEEREFPSGASEAPEGVTRREMVTLIGASLSLAGLAACRRPEHHIVPYVDPPETVIPGVPRHYATTLPVGRQALGLVVESHEGRPTKVEGNSLHSATLGASNVRAQAAILDLYDPDRSQTVRQAGQPKTWADFTAAWAALEKDHLADGGAGLAVLSGMSSSPTLARLRAAFAARFPRATWTVAEAVSDENALNGLQRVAGRPLDTVLAVEKARIIVALDADLFGAHPDAIRNMRGFAEGRRAGASGGVMNRLYAVEGVHSLTGAMADHRLRLRSSRLPAFLVEMAKAVGVAGDAASASTPAWIDAQARAFIDAVAGDLKEARGAGLLVAGDRQPAEVHAAVAAINAALGNAGATVSYREPAQASLPSRAALANLARAMQAGSVKTLVVLGGNPAYDTAADLGFADALKKVANVIALTDHVDETAKAAAWHLPRAHAFEAWGDARALGGPLSVVQPLILPLYGGRSDLEIAGLIATGKETPGYDLVRETWKPILGGDFETAWGRVLHDGLLGGSELPAVAITPNGRPMADLAAL
ncbi:MAG TPA: TAT-variant-translocated molybdopterin oxidoreductase, partial [Candidatus Polarisedimenticolia bacterium]|nr:TAT-variant-translocated molybdopterin oxidoreductase [Candidatus Polarisedimenticolia bacterium]